MPPQLALLLSLGFSFVLLRRELKNHPEVSSAVWIPSVWVLILGSRAVSQWLNLTTPYDADYLMDGSPTDRVVYAVLMASAFCVVMWRRVGLRRVIVNNPILVLFFSYCALSVMWSDFPAVAFKRWFKSLGDLFIALVLLSETRPAAAIASVLRRCAFLLMPLSIVFIKYYPELGRTHDPWSGLQYYTGVTTNKNMLGYLLFVFGLFFVCTLFTKSQQRDKTERTLQRTEFAIAAVFLLMIVYLSRMADSKTPLLALLVGASIAGSLRVAMVRKYFGAFAATIVLSALALQLLFSLGNIVIESAGRDATLTGRTEIWAEVLPMARSPLLGAGFQSFWLGPRLERMWEIFPVFRPNQAHNGYIEVYLNLGLVGLVTLIALIISTYRTARRRLADADHRSDVPLDDRVVATFGLCYVIALLPYNVTEATFQPLNLLFIVFIVLAFKVPSVSSQPVAARRVESVPVAASHRFGQNRAAWRPRANHIQDNRVTTWGKADGRTMATTRPGRGSLYRRPSTSGAAPGRGGR